MPLPALRDRLAKGPVLSSWSTSTDPLVHDALLRSAFDAIAFDMQHGLHDVASVAAGVARAALLGKPAIVRVPIEDRAMASRALDFGASAVIMPMIESADEAAAFMSVVKYPPLGLRSFGPGRALDVHGYGSSSDYTADADEQTIAFAMIETRAALDGLDAILAIRGIDGVFVGPSDLSIALSGEGRRDPDNAETVEAIGNIAAAARSAGKFAAIYASDAADARRCFAFGFHLVCVSSDVAMLKTAAATLAADIRS